MVFTGPIVAAAEQSETTYKIYPIPKQISYSEGSWALRDLNVVYDNEVDSATKARLGEVAELKGLSVTESDAANGAKTNIFVGVHGSQGPASRVISQNVESDAATFEGIDAYQLVVRDNNIYVLGKDTDSAFYGLTTLYHVVKQIDARTIRNFSVTDSADVVSRGFIEGYYGNPWSLEDRISLMEWGGYYKLNSYFYAPKDDPKHNKEWRELYTQEELDTLIKPLAEAGNSSKTRFVYALHPLMYNPIRFESSYEQDLKVLQDKFAQVLSAGVRQIAILADDAKLQKQEYTIRLLTDMTNWLKQQKEIYPDLKLTLPYCVQEYMSYGHPYFQQFPSNVQIIMTGGRVWGEVSQDFTERFTQTAGRGPYLWINWPCTDNSKQHLIMGGYSTFLHPNVDPTNIQGIVLNPMQQSEPSKVGIFGNAAYSWNIWDSEDEAEQAWRDSFSFVQDNSAVASPASEALFELSKHQINQNMSSIVRELQESVELREHLNALLEKIQAGTVTSEDIASVRAEFKVLQDAAKTFRELGNPKLLGNMDDYSAPDANEQMAPWLDAWDDTTAAALAYLDAVESYINDDVSMMMNQLATAQQAFADSKTHKFYYVNHYEYAEVGVQHIVPFIESIDRYLNDQVRIVSNPEAVVTTYISDVFTNPTSGSIDSILDSDDSTIAEFRNPNFLYKDNYVGLKFSRPMTLENARFAFGGGKNHFYAAKVQYTLDGEAWTDASSEVFERPRGNETPIEISGLSIEGVTGVRLIATRDNGDDLWLNIKGIEVNREVGDEPYQLTDISLENLVVAAYALPNAIDANLSTQVQLKTGNGQDYMEPNSAVVVDLGQAREIGRVVVHSGDDRAPNDRPVKAVVEVSSDKNEWTYFGNLNEETATGKATARYVRVRNTVHAPVWWRLREVEVFPPAAGSTPVGVYTNVEETTLTANEIDNGAELSDGTITLAPGQYIGIDLGQIRSLTEVTPAANAGKAVLQLGNNEYVWREVDDVKDRSARYVRLLNTFEETYTVDVTGFAVKYLVVGEYGRLVSSDIPVAANWNDTREDGQGFDQDMTTVTKFGGNPRAGNTAVYDLGRPIPISSVRIYTPDSQTDYIRDARIQLSADGNTWEDAFEIGDRTTDSDRETSFGSINDPNKMVDSTYPNVLYYGNDDLNGKVAQYIRILITADYPNRAIVFNEIMLNQGEYLSPEANAEFSSTIIEAPGHNPSKMTDGDFSTAWVPTSTDGVLTRQVNEAVPALRLVSAGKPAGATVKAEIVNADGEVSEVVLGTLDQPITDFFMPKGAVVLSYSLEWGEQIPRISEAITLASAEEATDAKSALRALVEKTPSNFASWTAQAKADFEALKTSAQRVLASEYVAKSTVESMTQTMQRAIQNAPVQADPELLGQLRILVDSAVSNDKRYYTGDTFAFYENTVKTAQAALENAENLTTGELEVFIGKINSAKEALKYSVHQRELAQRASTEAEGVEGNEFSEESFAAFEEARTALTNALAASDTTPMEFERLLSELNDARKALEPAEPEQSESTGTTGTSDPSGTTGTSNPSESTEGTGPDEGETPALIDIADETKVQILSPQKIEVEKVDSENPVEYADLKANGFKVVKVETANEGVPRVAARSVLAEGEDPDQDIAELVYGEDFEVSISNPTKAGDTTVVVTGIGKYTGEVEKPLTIAVKKAPSEPSATQSTETTTTQPSQSQTTVPTTSGEPSEPEGDQTSPTQTPSQSDETVSASDQPGNATTSGQVGASDGGNFAKPGGLAKTGAGVLPLAAAVLALLTGGTVMVLRRYREQ
ncbi:MAG: beta-N-acetylglucosaminidase domain-containing protein [Actinomycetaceae bacterium]|nr:beta-N-acetylglucosaminidase domain-containing protein [Actinomycetaceae bacterium]